jgi:hypothetical protein
MLNGSAAGNGDEFLKISCNETTKMRQFVKRRHLTNPSAEEVDCFAYCGVSVNKLGLILRISRRNKPMAKGGMDKSACSLVGEHRKCCDEFFSLVE